MNNSLNNTKTLSLPDMFIAGSLFIFIIWETLSGFILKIDAAARIPHILLYTSFIAALLFCDGIRLLCKFTLPLSICLLWMLYNIANVCIRFNSVVGYASKPYFIWLFAAKLVFLLLLLIMLQRHERFMLGILSCSLLVITVLFLCFSEKKIFSSEGHTRLFAHEIINPNSAAFTCVIILILSFYWLFSSSPQRFFGVACGILAVVTIFLTVSRTAAITAIIVVPLALFSFLRDKKAYFMVKLFTSIAAILTLSALLSSSSIMEKSALSYRFNYRTFELEQFQLEDNLLTRVFGERSIYFYEGVELFENNPLWGVGYNNYILYSKYGTRCHVEYITQLAEGGIFGAALYLLFLLSVILPVLIGHNTPFKQRLFYYCGGLAMLLFGAGAFTSMKDNFYILCALTLYSKLSVPENDPAAENAQVTPTETSPEAK